MNWYLLHKTGIWYPMVIVYNYPTISDTLIIKIEEEKELRHVMKEFFHIFYERGFFHDLKNNHHYKKAIWRVFLERTKEDAIENAYWVMKEFLMYWKEEDRDKNGDVLEFNLHKIDILFGFEPLHKTYIDIRTRELGNEYNR